MTTQSPCFLPEGTPISSKVLGARGGLGAAVALDAAAGFDAAGFDDGAEDAGMGFFCGTGLGREAGAAWAGGRV